MVRVIVAMTWPVKSILYSLMLEDDIDVVTTQLLSLMITMKLKFNNLTTFIWTLDSNMFLSFTKSLTLPNKAYKFTLSLPFQFYLYLQKSRAVKLSLHIGKLSLLVLPPVQVIYPHFLVSKNGKYQPS